MDKQLIEILAKSPEAVEIGSKYIEYLYFKMYFAGGLVFVFIVVLIFLVLYMEEKW